MGKDAFLHPCPQIAALGSCLVPPSTKGRPAFPFTYLPLADVDHSSCHAVIVHGSTNKNQICVFVSIKVHGAKRSTKVRANLGGLKITIVKLFPFLDLPDPRHLHILLFFFSPSSGLSHPFIHCLGLKEREIYTVGKHGAAAHFNSFETDVAVMASQKEHWRLKFYKDAKDFIC